jgi:hypothetical protein
VERKRLRGSVCRRAGRNEYKFRLNAAAESAGSVFMSSGVILLVLVMCQPSLLFAQTVLPAKQSHGRYQEGSTSEVVARLKEVTVDPKTVVQAKKTVPNSVGVPKPELGRRLFGRPTAFCTVQ